MCSDKTQDNSENRRENDRQPEVWFAALHHSTRILDQAIVYATVKHSGTFRKGTSIPYIVHPMEVAAIVSGLTDDQDVMAAAVLHDVLEDTGTSHRELVQLFGKKIAGLVADESEDKREDRPAAETWSIRKEETIRRLKKSSHEARMIALGDKLANARAIELDQERSGDSFWLRFNQSDKDAQAWYYRSVLKVLQSDPELQGHPLLREFGERLDRIFADV